MPALFAYLVAVMLLLGGGYGALTWLAAPEPVKVVTKTKPKTVRHYETIPPVIGRSDTPTASSETNAPDESKERASENTMSKDAVALTNPQPSPLPMSNQPRPDTRSQVQAHANGQLNEHVNKQVNEPASRDRPAAIPEPVQDAKNRAARAEVPAAETKRKVSEGAQPAPSRPGPRQSSGHPKTVAAADAAAENTVDRPRPNQASRRSERSASERPAHAERRGLVRMTLRTIEFPDGSRATRLIPYRGAERDLDDDD